MGVVPATVSGGVVEGDLACAGCGYNLRTMRFGGRCPECGEWVERSYWFRLPENYGWKRLRGGALMLAMSPWVNLAMVPVFLNFRNRGIGIFLIMGWMVPQLLLHGVRCAGVIMIAWSRPGQRTRAQQWCMALGVALAIFWLILDFYVGLRPAEQQIVFWLLAVIFLVEGALTFAADRWVRSARCPFYVERHGRTWPRALRPAAYLLAGASAVLLAMAMVPGLKQSDLAVALYALAWGAFLWSRVVHVSFWLLIEEVVNRRMMFL